LKVMFSIHNGAELTLLFVPARNTARARQKGWGPLIQIFRICRHGKVPYRHWPQRRFTSAGLLHHPLPRSMEQVAGSSTPAPGPNALPFGTPVATGAAQVLCFGASPLVRATALPAPAAAGAVKKRRTVLLDKTNTPAIMPAPTKCSAPRTRGKGRSRTPADTVGAAQRLGPNLEKLNDSAECFAVEGTVTGELGRQHYACGWRSASSAGVCRRAPGEGACRQRTRKPSPKRPLRCLCWRTTVGSRLASRLHQGASASILLGAVWKK